MSKQSTHNLLNQMWPNQKQLNRTRRPPRRLGEDDEPSQGGGRAGGRGGGGGGRPSRGGPPRGGDRGGGRARVKALSCLDDRPLTPSASGTMAEDDREVEEALDEEAEEETLDGEARDQEMESTGDQERESTRDQEMESTGDQERESTRDQEMEDLEMDAQRESEKVWLRGTACLPKNPPATEDEKTLITPKGKDNWDFVGPPGRLPNGLLGILVKDFWPGMYKTDPQREERVLATSWKDYPAASLGDKGTHADAVVSRFRPREVPTRPIAAKYVEYTVKETGVIVATRSTWKRR